MGTWFKLYREIFDSDLWTDVTTFRLFLLLIGKASHRDGVTIAGVELKRGQYLRSYRKLAEDLAYKEGRGTKTYSLKTIKKCVDKLISDERVNVQETEQGTLFTILNYDKYQGFLDDEEETGNGLDSEQVTNGKLTGNNNKNANNAKKDISSSSNIGAELIDEDWKEVIGFYRENLQVGVTEIPHNEKRLLDLYEIFGKDLVLAAMKLSAEKGKKEVAYVNGILSKWRDAGVKTIEDARKFELNFRANQKVYQFNRGDRIENNEPNYELPPQKNGHVRLYK